jgi:peptidoglycan/LPS O-acetylase OafA/YrhL
MHHFFIPTPWTSPPLRFLAHGYIAVDLFFSLSGFVMALNYSAMFINGAGLATFRVFFGRRLARIYPLYVFTLIVASVLVATHHLEFRAESFSLIFWSNLFMVQNWGPWESMNPPSWSLSAELFAYLLFPFLIQVVLSRSRSVRSFATAICVLGLTVVCFHSPVHLPASLSINYFEGPFSLLRCVAEFGLGLIAYQFSSTRQGGLNSMPLSPADPLFIVIALLLTIQGTDLLLALLFPCWIVTLVQGRSLIGRILGAKPVHYLGLLSFSIYLSHWLFNPVVGYLDLLARRAHLSHTHTYAVVIALPLLLSASSATYHFLEVPGRRIMRGVFEPRRAALVKSHV